MRRAIRSLWALAALTLTALAFGQAVGDPLPSFALRDQHGVLVISDELEGQRWLVNVWASWCPPCQAELPLLQRAVSELESEGLGLLLINTTETASVASAFLEAEGLELRTLVDPDRREAGLEPVIGVLRRLRTAGLPTTYFLAEDGRLLATYVGELTPDVLAERLATVFGLDWEP
jgi:cytochrome c biogenesis protein CcmG, thiol:disulfide interchange protein DsbE